ncbi:MAG: pyridoxamine 5'-phosphate oxidase family protein [Alphaproteobacteria bacterium]|nr:MAG: pyridoxamine 5'-phosphate oxidase family protein [Alphaproteobacteria bacterium]
MSEYSKTERNRVKRGHKRALYDHETVHAILDSHFLCHVGFELDGQPHVIPTSFWREGNRLYWHGSSASRMVRHLAAGNRACVTVSHLDGLVLARSAFSHSANYRSVVCYGSPELVTDDAEFDRQMILFMERLAPGRWPQLRPMTAQERKATAMLVMEIEEAAAKVRAGAPGDPEEASWPVWAGHVPISMVQGTPVIADDSASASMDHGLMQGYDWSREQGAE